MFQFVYTVDCIYSFKYGEPFPYIWNKAFFIILDDLSDLFMDLFANILLKRSVFIRELLSNSDSLLCLIRFEY